MQRFLFVSTLFASILLLLTACGPSVTQARPQLTVVVNPKFQSQVSPIPTVPATRCGAWASNNAPTAGSTITIYARITRNAQPVAGATANATVHFRSGDQQLPQTTSDTGGYIAFPLQLQGQQPNDIPATVDVTFANIPNGPASLKCTPAFFTPQQGQQPQQGK